MPGDLIHSNYNLPMLGNGQLPAKVERQVRQGVAEAAGRSIVAAAKIQGASFVASVALTQTAMLSAQEAALAAQDPIAAARYSGIVDDFLMVARGTIRGLI